MVCETHLTTYINLFLEAIISVSRGPFRREPYRVSNSLANVESTTRLLEVLWDNGTHREAIGMQCHCPREVMYVAVFSHSTFLRLTNFRKLLCAIVLLFLVYTVFLLPIQWHVSNENYN